jgi:hypothetical protein
VKRLDDCPFLARDQWDIFSGPAEDLFKARSHEYARENPERVIAVDRWRAHAKEQSFEGYLALYQDPRAPAPPSTVLGDDLYALLSEWPTTAFHRIDATVLTQRLSQLCPRSEQELRARRFNPDSALMLDTEYGFERLMRRLQKGWQQFRRWCDRPNSFSELHLMQTDWWDSDRRLLEDYAAWLKVNRPANCKVYTTQGGGSFERQYQTDLKALAALRLWAASGGKWFDCPPLYSDQSHWERAISRAEDLIARSYPLAL